MFGITEIKESYTNRTPGFQVRLGWKNGLPLIVAEFTTLEAATIYRDVELKKLKKAGIWPVDRHRDMDNLTVRNTSGINGVSRNSQSRTVNGVIVKSSIYRWTATWCVGKTRKTASFSENKWGADTACQMARECYEARENIHAK